MLWMKVSSVSEGLILTHSSLGISLAIVIWIFSTSENNFQIKHKFTKYLRSCLFSFDQHFSFKNVKLLFLNFSIWPLEISACSY